MEEESGTLEVEDAGADSSDSPAEVRVIQIQPLTQRQIQTQIWLSCRGDTHSQPHTNTLKTHRSKYKDKYDCPVEVRLIPCLIQIKPQTESKYKDKYVYQTFSHFRTFTDLTLLHFHIKKWNMLHFCQTSTHNPAKVKFLHGVSSIGWGSDNLIT